MSEAFEYAKLFEPIPEFKLGVYQWRQADILLVTNTTFGGVIAFDGQHEFVIKTERLKHLKPLNFCLSCGCEFECACK